MNWALSSRVNLAGGDIAAGDAARQTKTAGEILRRFAEQPGQILADEVGMGKTYVALAVAVSVLEATGRTRPIVIMVPPGVQAKWPKDWDVFQHRCMRIGHEIRATPQTVRRGSEFLKLLDDDPAKAMHIIFLSHGALTSPLSDAYIRLALVRRALARPTLKRQRGAFPRWAATILRAQWLDEDLARALMGAPVKRWADVYRKETGRQLSDDPVPDGLIEALQRVDLTDVVAALRDLPLRTGRHVEQRLREVRAPLQDALHDVWRECMSAVRKRSPLLILDEAHHAKNPWTALARLFDNPDADLIAALSGVFDRMLFLTATPFQLGHNELLEVLERFKAIRWKGLDRAAYEEYLNELEKALTAAQTAALMLDASWGRLTPRDVAGAEQDWWQQKGQASETLALVAGRYREVRANNRKAAVLLRTTVIRHVRGEKEHRRELYCGAEIPGKRQPGGIAVSDGALLPFLLAARTQAIVALAARTGDGVTGPGSPRGWLHPSRLTETLVARMGTPRSMM